MEPSTFREATLPSQPVSSTVMGFYWPTAIGFFLGFAFGVGCALAVMYSIYTGGYRAALRDTHAAVPPKRLREALDRLHLPQRPLPPSTPAPPSEP